MSAFLGGLTSGLAGGASSSDGSDWKSKQKMSNSKSPASSGKSTASADDAAGQSAGTYKRGGKVRKTGRAKVHKGERVLTAKQAKRYEKRGAKRG